MTNIPNESSLRDKIRGCLLGVAIGNALGAPFEHLLPGETNQAIERSGGRIIDFHPYWCCPAGAWTDDTGMTLAGVRALIEMEKTGLSLEVAFQKAFFDWAGSLECREPGGTVLYAAQYATADLNSWSNGALMRIAPAGIYTSLKGFDTEKSAEIAYRVARITHFRPWRSSRPFPPRSPSARSSVANKASPICRKPTPSAGNTSRQIGRALRFNSSKIIWTDVPDRSASCRPSPVFGCGAT